MSLCICLRYMALHLLTGFLGCRLGSDIAWTTKRLHNKGHVSTVLSSHVLDVLSFLRNLQFLKWIPSVAASYCDISQHLIPFPIPEVQLFLGLLVGGETSFQTPRCTPRPWQHLPWRSTYSSAAVATDTRAIRLLGPQGGFNERRDFPDVQQAHMPPAKDQGAENCKNFRSS